MKEDETKAYIKKTNEIKHNSKNMYIGLMALINEGKYSEAVDILNSQIDLSVNGFKPISDCPDSAINTILTYKIANADKYNVAVRLNILLTKSVNIKYDDLSIILGNLFDNAVEYLAESDGLEKIVDFSLKYDYGIMKLLISNPVSECIDIPEDYIIPTRKSSADHGYGLTSVKKIVEKHNGVFSIKCTDSEFTVCISLIVEGSNQ